MNTLQILCESHSDVFMSFLTPDGQKPADTESDAVTVGVVFKQDFVQKRICLNEELLWFVDKSINSAVLWLESEAFCIVSCGQRKQAPGFDMEIMEVTKSLVVFSVFCNSCCESL